MRNEDKYTIIYFKDGSEKLIKGFEEADTFASMHEDEILLTYTDHDGSEHLDEKFAEMHKEDTKNNIEEREDKIMWSKEKVYYVGGIIDATINCHRMKDIYIMLEEVEEDTGYNVEFLWDVMKESLDDGETWEEAVKGTITIAYEYDY